MGSSAFLRADRRFAAAVVSLLLAFSVVIAPPPAVAADPFIPDNDIENAALGVYNLAVVLDALGFQEELGQPLPFAIASTTELLSLDSIFGDSLGATIAAGGGALSTAQQLEDLIKTADDAAIDGVTIDYSGVTVDDNGSKVTVQLPVTLTRDNVAVPVGYTDGQNILIDGRSATPTVSIETDLSYTATFALEYDPSYATADTAIALVPTGAPASLPAVQITATADDGAGGTQVVGSIPSRVGFTDVSAAGNARYSVVVNGTFADPDGDDRVTQDEWITTLLDDLVNLSYGPSDVDVQLTVDSPLVAGADDGSIDFISTALPTIPDPTDPDLNLNDLRVTPSLDDELDDFLNIDADEALTGLAELAAILTAGQAAADTSVPLTSGSLSDVFSPADRLLDFVQQQADALVVCGQADTQPPTGNPDVGGTIYCQAFSASDATTATWSVAAGSGAVDPGNAADPATVGIAPTKNAKFTGVAADTEIEVTFTDAAGSHTVKPRFRTIQELAGELDDVLGSAAAAGLAFDTTTRSLTIPIAYTETPSAASASWELGDEIRQDTNLSALIQDPGAAGSPSISIPGPDGVAVSTTFGIVLVDDLADIDPSDTTTERKFDHRFFMNAAAGSPTALMTAETIAVGGSPDLMGLIGYLEVDATAGGVTLSKIDGGKKGVAVEVTNPIGNLEVAVSGATQSITDAIQLRRVLAGFDPGTGVEPLVTADHNLAATATLTVAPRAPLASLAASGTVKVDWADVAGSPSAAPTADASGDAFADLQLFDIVPTVEGAASAAGANLTDSGRDFTSELGFIDDPAAVVALLVNITDGSSCSEFAITSATTLSCTLAGGTNNTWAEGDRYQIRGELEALEAPILNGLFQLAGAIGGTSETDFTTKLPLVGLSPLDMVTPHLADVQATAQDFLLGTAAGLDAYVICSLSPENPDKVNCELVTELTVKNDSVDWTVTGVDETSPISTTASPHQIQVTLDNDNLTDFTVRADFTNAADDSAVSGTLAPDPTSLQGLYEQTVARLGIDPGDLTFALADHSHPDDPGPASPHLEAKLTMDNPMPASALATPFRMSFGTATGLEGVEISGATAADRLTLDSASASVQLDLAVPLARTVSPDDVIVLGTTAANAAVTLDQSTFEIDVTLGALTGKIGAVTKATGTHEPVTGTHTGADKVVTHTETTASATTLTQSGATFVADGITANGAWKITRDAGGSCIINGVTADTLSCSGLSGGNEWAENDTGKVTPTRVLTDSAVTDFGAEGVAADGNFTVNNTTRAASCTVDTVGTDSLTCSAGLSGGESWFNGDGYRVDSTTVLRDTSVDFVTDLGVVIGDVVVHEPGTGNEASCLITAVAPTTVTCSTGLDNGQSWDSSSDDYEISSPAAAKLDASAGLTGSNEVSVATWATGATASLSSAGVDCGAGLTGDACARFGVLLDDDGTLKPIGSTVNFKADPFGSETVTGTPDLTALAAAVAAFSIEWSLLPTGFEFLDDIYEIAFDGDLTDTHVPLAGGDLDAGANLDEVLAAIDVSEITGTNLGGDIADGDLVESVRTKIAARVADASPDLVAGDVTVTLDCSGSCTDGVDTAANISEAVVSFQLTSPNAGADPQATEVPFGIGLPGLTVFSDSNLEGQVKWTLDVAFGLGRKAGPFVPADGTANKADITEAVIQFKNATSNCTQGAPSELQAKVAGLSVSDRCIDGITGFLPADLWDQDGAQRSRAEFASAVGLSDSDSVYDFRDLLDGVNQTAVPTVSASATNLVMRTLLPDDQGFPSVLGTLNVTHDGTDYADPTFGNLYLDLGTFVSGLVDPTLSEVKRFTKPFQPVIDTLKAPIPVVSDVSRMVGGGDITLLSLLEAISSNQLDMIIRIINLIDFVNNLPSKDGILIPLGDGEAGEFKVEASAVKTSSCAKSTDDTSKVTTKTCTGDGTSSISKEKPIKSGTTKGGTNFSSSAFASASMSGAGVSFPFMNDATEIYGVLLGFDTTLVRFDSGTLAASAGMSVSFGPIAIGPVPVEIHIGGSVTLKGRFAIGYDTRGLRRLLTDEDPATGSYLLDGIFIDDLDTAGVDVPEIELITVFTLGASVSIKIFKVGVEGGVQLTIALNLNDPDDDGKLRVEEILLWRFNPICLFDVTGTLEFFLNFFLEIDLGIFSKKFSWELYRTKPPITIFEFSCEPPQPVLAVNETNGDGDPTNDLLKLTMGAFASQRNAFAGETEEKYVVTQLSETTSAGTRLGVSAFGFYEEHILANGGKVWARAGGDKDTIILRAGSINPDVAASGKLNINGDGSLNGDKFTPLIDSNDDGFLRDVDIVVGVTPSSGVDVEIINGEVDLDGSGTVDGNDDGELAGVKVFNGRVDIDGDGVVDADDRGVFPVDVEFRFTVAADIDGEGDEDRLVTGDGDDIVGGGSENDKINTGSGDDFVDAGTGDDGVEAGIGDDVVDAGPGDDQVNGGPGADLVFGDTGIDTLTGGPGLKPPAPPGDEDLLDGGDVLIGGGNDDTLQGGFGPDYLFGDDYLKSGVAFVPTVSSTTSAERTHIAANVAALCALSNQGSSGDDGIAGSDDADILFGGPGNDEITGGGEGDVLCGNGGNDILDGDQGEDLADAGDDTIDGGSGNDSLFGRQGHDELKGQAGHDLLDGAEGPDDLIGGTGMDVLLGDVGDDIMLGDAGTIAAHSAGDHGLGFETSVTPSSVHTLGGTVACLVRTTVIAGKADVNDDGAIDGNDDGFVGGRRVINGAVDYDGSGAIEAEEDNGLLDDAVITGGDIELADGSANGTLQLVAVTGSNQNADCLFGGFGDDLMFGEDGDDFILGDRGNDYAEGNADADTVRGGPGNDELLGDDERLAIPADDIAYAAFATARVGWNDTMFGDSGRDRMFGNFGADIMRGGLDRDSMAGGSALADAPDGGDTMNGDAADDVMAGDNALISRPGAGEDPLVALLDVPFAVGPSVRPEAAGADLMFGDAGDDVMYGQSGTGRDNDGDGSTDEDAVDGFDNDTDALVDEDPDGDEMYGGPGGDRMEGNADSDLMFGGDDDDFMVGGSGLDHGGVNWALRELRGVEDAGDVMRGEDGQDVMTGDNAGIADGTRLVTLYDINSADTSLSGGDQMDGGPLADEMFGQGNGNQPAAQRDPSDGMVDNDLDGVADEDPQWLGDAMFGRGGADYMEGNHGADLMVGGDGADDMVGGGSALDGVIDDDRNGTGLHDRGDVMYGDDPADGAAAGTDRMTGDNAWFGSIVLFDVNSLSPAVSGADYMDGGPLADEMFGQGNGGQLATQRDPIDGGVDNDGDFDIEGADEDQPWDGDIMYGRGGDDYMEGNHGSDLMYGGGDEDDMIGGGSANEGDATAIIDDDRNGDGLRDRGDIMYGGDAVDFMTGDNAWIDRDGNLALTGLALPAVTDRGVTLFDVLTEGDDPLDFAAYSGGDWMSGGAAADVMFGQGNGAQGPDQRDPIDGVDNDRDGREDPLAPDIGYDCLDAYDNDGLGGTDAADPDCTDDVDEDQPWFGDLMFGDGGDDYMEGNHGSDWMFGGADEDDMTGGGSAADGMIDADRSGVTLLDRHDIMHGQAEDDVMAGDNAVILRTLAGGDWLRLSGAGGFDLAVRTTTMAQAPEADDAFGDDYMIGDVGHDEMYGQLGHDYMEGNAGDDAMLGDVGQVTTNLLGDGVDDPPLDVFIEPNEPFIDDTIFVSGTLYRLTELFAHDTDNDPAAAGGADVMLGGDGADSMHGGPGDDIMQGDDGRDVTEVIVDPENTGLSFIDENGDGVDNDGLDDEDHIFGGDGDDVAWGGRGHDHLYGGHGDDYLDVRPRPEMDNGRKGGQNAIIPRDPPEWFTYGSPESYHGIDYVYGGWDQDAMQANVADFGPNVGDRLLDWVGAYNIFYLCPALYGEFVITRDHSPGIQGFLQDLSRGDGAIDSATPGSSGFRELGFVFPNEARFNSHPIHPDTPGHFVCAP